MTNFLREVTHTHFSDTVTKVLQYDRYLIIDKSNRYDASMNKSQLKTEIRTYTDNLRVQQTIEVNASEDGSSITVTFSKGQSFTATLTESERQDPIAQCNDIEYFHYHLTRWCSRWE